MKCFPKMKRGRWFYETAYYKKNKSFKILNNGILFQVQTSFHQTNNMAPIGLLEMLYFPIYMFTTDGIIGCVMSDTWFQMVWQLVTDVGPHT